MTASSNSSKADRLLTARAVRERAEAVFEAAQAGSLAHVAVDLGKLPEVVARTVAAIETGYPDFQIPPFGCWRAFEAGGHDRWSALAGARGFDTPEAFLRAAADLAILSHVLSVPVRDGWALNDAMTGETFSGREGLAVGVLSMFAAGSFSADPADPLRADAHALIRLEEDEIAWGLQLDRNRDGEMILSVTELLRRLGEATGLRPDLFEVDGATRPGYVVDRFFADSANAPVELTALLEALLDGLSPMWQGGAQLDDVTLGDAWHHSTLLQDLDAPGIVPFHLPAQEMAYALVEPFAWVGVEVAGLDGLTGLANLEHAALFLDTGVLTFKGAPDAEPDGPAALDLAIELRALTIALIDRLATTLRQELDAPEGALPLTCIMEGGTIPAGREVLLKNGEFYRKIARILAAGGVNWLPFGA
ncbi:DUF1688 family protein [Roseibium aggregatum]|uniref:DUF1688 family protein n=1 Tax=Roseibium aggregatum TaxID=187304 RepID=A0A926P1L7_9HYPH|nr:DUF1688 family protein [Roseibium aggregatum]MBD1544772.1 DUF1688 family protein [Roseibium aggregatum]